MKVKVWIDMGFLFKLGGVFKFKFGTGPLMNWDLEKGTVDGGLMALFNFKYTQLVEVEGRLEANGLDLTTGYRELRLTLTPTTGTVASDNAAAAKPGMGCALALTLGEVAKLMAVFGVVNGAAKLGITGVFGGIAGALVSLLTVLAASMDSIVPGFDKAVMAGLTDVAGFFERLGSISGGLGALKSGINSLKSYLPKVNAFKLANGAMPSGSLQGGPLVMTEIKWNAFADKPNKIQDAGLYAGMYAVAKANFGLAGTDVSIKAKGYHGYGLTTYDKNDLFHRLVASAPKENVTLNKTMQDMLALNGKDNLEAPEMEPGDDQGPGRLIDVASLFTDAEPWDFVVLEDKIEYRCCCRKVADQSIRCTLTNMQKTKKLFYKSGCGGAMGDGYHSWDSKEMGKYKSLEGAGRCMVAHNELPLFLQKKFA